MSREGEFIIIGTVTSQGVYADGKDICELIICKESSNRVPHEYGKKESIEMLIGNTLYKADIHETQKGVIGYPQYYMRKA